MTIERKNYPQLSEPVGPYVHAVKHQGVLYLSGLTAFGTSAQSGSAAEQVGVIFDQVASVAEAEGVGAEALLKVTVFITDFNEIGDLRRALFAAYGDALPASSMVRVGGLFAPDLKVEVEAVLAVPQGDQVYEVHVVGAQSQVGQYTVGLLSESDHTIRMMVRKEVVTPQVRKTTNHEGLTTAK